MQKRWKPNVTVAAVIEREGRFLLVEEQTSEGLRLNNPAGHLDPEESLLQACSREVLEETAHTFEPTSLVGVYLTRLQHPPKGERQITSTTYLRFTFAGTLGAFDPWRSLDHGIVRTVWMSADEVRASAARHRSPALLRSVDDYLAGARYPLSLLHTDLGSGLAF
jgi:8-oxo-dGTP pyrophosphatase MutT (NUDIX family)